MSTTTLYKLYKTKVTEFAEFQNGHGSAPPIWDYLCKRFIGADANYYSNVNELWPLAKDKRVPEILRVVHSFTFDGAYCPTEKLDILINASLIAYKTFNECEQWGPSKVNHWQAIGEAIRKEKFNKNCCGVVIGCTSVCDPWEWAGKKECGEAWDCIEYARDIKAAT